MDATGAAYVTGYTFPVTSRRRVAHLTFRVSAYDAFVTKLTADGTSLAYSTYLGGGGADAG